MSNATSLLQFGAFNRVKPILQTETSECGLACLAMIAYYYGHKRDMNSLRREHPVSIKGTTLQGIMHIGEKLGFASRPIRLEVSDLNKLKLPCILHWNMQHFVVLKKVSSRQITIIDPATGEKQYSHESIGKHFTGVALELTTTRKFERKNRERKLHLNELWETIRGLNVSFFQVFILSMLLQLFAIVSPFYMQLVVDKVIVSHDHNLLTLLCIGFALLMLLNHLVMALRSIVVMIISNQLNIQIANNIFHHLIRLPLKWFESRHIGDVVSRFNSIEQVKQLLSTAVIEVLVDGIMIIGTLVMMFVYNSFLAWIVLSSAVAYGLFRLAFYRPLKRLTDENIVAKARQDSNFIESVRASQSIKLFNQETQRQLLWNNYYADAMNTGIRLTKLDIGYRWVNGVLFGAENVLVIYLAATAVINELMSVGMLYAFMAYKGQFTGKAVSVIEKLIQFKMLSVHLARIGDIVLNPVEQDKGIENHSCLSGELALENLSFRYSPEVPRIIRSVNFRIRAGESVAIIGPSGCGKTTLMKLALGLLSPDSGRVLVDGIDIATVGKTQYRRQIAAVMQDDQLLSGSIADNICFFDADSEQSLIEASAKSASIHEDIMAMPMGYNSLIGDMGNSLSGGQKQRLLLARALYKRPKILFLDEATSHLDTTLEAVVNRSIRKMEITRIIIAHRKETIDSADRVLLLEGGKIKELIKQGGEPIGVPHLD